MPKVIYVSRLFSGLEKSIIDERWLPTGVPTIFRMIERLRLLNQDFKLLLTVKDGYSHYNCPIDRCIHLQDFSHPIRILSGIKPAHTYLRKVAKYLREVRHLFQIWREIKNFHPDIVYIDHGNAWAAGILSRLTKVPFVFRIMGVYPAMRQVIDNPGWSPAKMLLRWCYRAPYAAVICTQDGSGIERWLDKALAKQVPVYKMINGLPVKPSKSDQAISKNAKTRSLLNVTFVGKLEHAKGVAQFVEAMCRINDKFPGHFFARIIGFGSLRDELIQKIADCGHADWFQFDERMSNSEVLQVLQSSDIYVSLNRYGNLSNANLEAIATGCCMILPRSQPDTGIDVVTDEILPSGATYKIESVDDIDGLVRAISHLGQNAAIRDQMRSKVRRVAESLESWDNRIDREMSILLALSATKQVSNENH